MMNKLLALCCIFLVAACNAEPQETAPGVPSTLAINLHGVQGSAGKLMIAIYDKPEAFDNNANALAWISLPASTRKVTLSNFSVGTLAITAFHDKNENNDLDMNGGVPVEGYGYSGDVGKWDQPAFSKASFEGRAANVKIHYIQ